MLGTKADSKLYQAQAPQRHIHASISRGNLARQRLLSDNSYLGMMEPADALCAGGTDAVEGVLSAMDYGFGT